MPAFFVNIAVVPLIHAAKVSSDVLTYVHVQERWDLADQVYPHAYSKIASSAVSEALFFVPLPSDLPPVTTPIAKIAGVSIGRATGKAMAEKQRSIVEKEQAVDRGAESN